MSAARSLAAPASRPPASRPPGPRSPAARPLARWGGSAGLVILLVWAVHGAGVGPASLAGADVQGAQVLRGVLSPELDPRFLAAVAAAAVQTVQIAIAGLVLAVVLAAPLALVLTGSSAGPRLPREAARLVAGALRAVPELVWALVFVAMVGLGPAAGAYALGLHGGGLLAKLWAEQLDAVDRGPVEAVRLAGASRGAVLALSVLPQAASGLMSLLLYQFECNIRAATVLGIVGAGGLGAAIDLSLRLFDYGELGTLVLATMLLVLGVDQLSRRIRRRLGAASTTVG